MTSWTALRADYGVAVTGGGLRSKMIGQALGRGGEVHESRRNGGWEANGAGGKRRGRDHVNKLPYRGQWRGGEISKPIRS